MADSQTFAATAHVAPADPLQTLNSVFGYDSFWPSQREIIECIIGGSDAFVLMPTGGGKSLCYQVPALHRPGTGVVISPLIALMKDQVDSLRANGVAAAYLNSSLSPGEADMVVKDLQSGALDLLYVAPERLMMDGMLELLRPLEIALFAIDEAHCISQWGHDFRPEYQQLARLRELFPGVPLLALTATADEQTREDVRHQLRITGAPVFATGFDRPNIRYTVSDKHNAPAQLERFISSHPSDSGIVYCLSRKRVEQVAARLQKSGIKAAAYHAGMPADERTHIQEAFQRDDVHVVVATVAFGMGIDKPDVRFVVHYDMPKNIEGYYQETGRAGRDGLPAEALLLFGLQDAMTARALIENSNSPEQIRIELHKLQAMIAFAEATTCRRRVLLGYFGDTLEDDCGNCDVCLDPPALYDATVDAQKALSAVYRMGQRFGIGQVIDVLRGSETDKVLQWRHNELSVFSVGAELSRNEWTSVIRQLIHRGYLRQDIAAYAALKLQEKARGVLRGEEALSLARPRAAMPRRSKTPARSIALDGMEIDEALFERLRELRRQLAAAEGVPAFVIFGDRALADMATSKPSTPEEFLEVYGVGQAKLERYGERFLAVISLR